MIRFEFSIGNPWYKDRPQVNYIEYDRKVAENWAFECQLSKMSTDWFSIDLDLSWRGRDHAGPSLTLELLGYYFCVRFYNVNHWNFDEGRWQTEADREAERAEWGNEQ